MSSIILLKQSPFQPFLLLPYVRTLGCFSCLWFMFFQIRKKPHLVQLGQKVENCETPVQSGIRPFTTIKSNKDQQCDEKLGLAQIGIQENSYTPGFWHVLQLKPPSNLLETAKTVCSIYQEQEDSFSFEESVCSTLDYQNQ